MIPGHERTRRCRQRQNFARAEIASKLAQEVTPQQLAAMLSRLQPRQVDLLVHQLLEKVDVTAACNDDGSNRVPLDAYFTPPLVALAVTQRIAEVISEYPSRILEPSAGLGAFMVAAGAQWPTASITGVDILVRPQLDALKARVGRQVVERDFLEYPGRSYDLILGNPPFSQAELHIEHALSMLRSGGHLAFILRQGFLGSATRAHGLWAKHWLRYFATIVPRPSFLAKGNDKTEYALYVWQGGYSGIAETGRPIDWRSPELRGAA